MPNTTTSKRSLKKDFKPADVVLVPFPFADLLAHKKRPALVMSYFSTSSLPALVVIAMITSKIESEKLKDDVFFQDWKKAGLLHPSKVRLGKLVTLEAHLIQKTLGRLSSQDQERLKKPWRSLFGHWL